MRNHLFKFLILFAIGALFLVVGIRKMIAQSPFDLKYADTIIGKVEEVGLSKTGYSQVRWKASEKFYFKLHNHEDPFSVYRGHGDYYDLRFAIRVGDTLKVYYDKGSGGYINDIYQLEEGRKVLLYYEDYSQEQKIITGIFLMIGLSLGVGSWWWYGGSTMIKLMFKKK